MLELIENDERDVKDRVETRGDSSGYRRGFWRLN